MNYFEAKHAIKIDLARIAEALYQDHPNAREVVRRYFEELVNYTKLMEGQAETIEDYANVYAAWGRALQMLLDAYEADDRVLMADIIIYELLPLL